MEVGGVWAEANFSVGAYFYDCLFFMAKTQRIVAWHTIMFHKPIKESPIRNH